MTSTALFVLEDGTVVGLYTEAIDLTELGRLQVERASTIEFDNTAQHWRVVDQHGHCRFTDPSRLRCLRWEQEFFTAEVIDRHTIGG